MRALPLGFLFSATALLSSTTLLSAAPLPRADRAEASAMARTAGGGTEGAAAESHAVAGAGGGAGAATERARTVATARGAGGARTAASSRSASRGAAASVGSVAFANSGAAVAQPAFLRGLALLHNFEYEQAAEAFRKAQKTDPSFAMAYWGEAMTYTHPIWFQQDAAAAAAALARLGATPAERLAKAKTERERDYLRAVDILYGDGAKDEASKNGRDILYAAAMSALHAKYPDDVDATAFYALAILGTAHDGRDFATYMRAAALLEEVFPSHRQHPGVLHYLIHSYDDPIHAPLGLRAARLYGAVAPNAAHALHMTSHIFIALGMWDEVIDANRRAIAVSNRDAAARSRPPTDCGHYPLWLHYANLQKGRFDDAAKGLDACRASAFAPRYETGGPMDSAEGRMSLYAEMRAHQIASGQAVPAPASIPEGERYDHTRFLIAYGDALAAKDAETAKAAAAAMHALLPSVSKKKSFAGAAAVMAEEADALALVAASRRDEALAILAKAAEAESAMPLDFGPPVVAKPAMELYADVLLAAGRTAEAAAAYRTALARTPGRAVTIAGAAAAGTR
jgi:hypothetical protein